MNENPPNNPTDSANTNGGDWRKHLTPLNLTIIFSIAALSFYAGMAANGNRDTVTSTIDNALEEEGLAFDEEGNLTVEGLTQKELEDLIINLKKESAREQAQNQNTPTRQENEPQNSYVNNELGFSANSPQESNPYQSRNPEIEDLTEVVFPIPAAQGSPTTSTTVTVEVWEELTPQRYLFNWWMSKHEFLEQYRDEITTNSTQKGSNEWVFIDTFDYGGAPNEVYLLSANQKVYAVNFEKVSHGQSLELTPAEREQMMQILETFTLLD